VPKPFIVYGQGIILGQGGRIKGITEKSGIPAAWTILGLSLPTDHLNVGMLECMGIMAKCFN
jgi:acetolactate synthase-1/2/3 large subunit